MQATDQTYKSYNTVRKVLTASGIVSLALAVFLSVWSIFVGDGAIASRYQGYLYWLSNLEIKIASIGHRWLIIVVILLMYFIKTAFSFYPVALLCVATAMVFNTPASLVINIAGLFILFTVRYYTGKWSGGGNAQKLVKRSKLAQKLIEAGGQGSPWALLVMRMIPAFPINSASQLYGAMGFPFWPYMSLSVGGYFPKMLFAIVVGRHVTNPFSIGGSLALIAICVVSGVIFFGMRAVWDATHRRQRAIVKSKRKQRAQESLPEKNTENQIGEENHVKT